MEFLNKYYQTEYPESAASWYSIKDDWNEERVNERANYVLQTARRWLGKDNVRYHESGCSFGGIVRKLNMLGYAATGAELNEKAVSEAHANGNLSIFCRDEAELFRGKEQVCEIFYSFHALEHMPDPQGFLVSIRKFLSKESIALLHVPNAICANSIMRGFYKNSWFAYPDHLHLFSPASIFCLADSTRYSVLDVSTNMIAQDTKQISEILGDDLDSIRGRAISQMIQDCRLGLELQFVLTRSDSKVAAKYAEQISALRRSIPLWRQQEIDYLKLQE